MPALSPCAMKWIACIMVLLLAGCTPPTTDVPGHEPDVRTVGFREPFDLFEGDTVGLANTTVQVSLRQLINSPCALVATCDWHGRAAHLYVNESGHSTRVEIVSQNFTYETEEYILGLVLSDFEKSAQFMFFPPGTNLTIHTKQLQQPTVKLKPPSTKNE